VHQLGHVAILHRDALVEAAPDEVVCATALRNEAILIAMDADMQQLAKQYGVTPKGDRFQRLSIIRLCCKETIASKRLKQAMTLIEHEWQFSQVKAARRLWIDVGPHSIKTYR